MTVGKPFAPGQSGNPGGRPKESNKVKELARVHTERAIEVLAESLADPKLKVSAAQALLDRGWGKAAQIISGDDDAPVRVIATIERIIVSPSDTDS